MKRSHRRQRDTNISRHIYRRMRNEFECLHLSRGRDKIEKIVKTTSFAIIMSFAHSLLHKSKTANERMRLNMCIVFTCIAKCKYITTTTMCVGAAGCR